MRDRCENRLKPAIGGAPRGRRVWCRSCSCHGMTMSPVSQTALAALLAAFTSAHSRAADTPPHIRVEAGLESVLADGLQSPTFQALVTGIEASNLIVYVRCKAFDDPLLDGRLSLMGATPESRYAVIELACPRPRFAQTVTLGHELRHANEVAAAPAVVDPASFKHLYDRIGFRLWAAPGAARYDTNAAITTGWQVRRELQRASALLNHPSRTATEEAK
jgi:hypothetical protein